MFLKVIRWVYFCFPQQAFCSTILKSGYVLIEMISTPTLWRSQPPKSTASVPLLPNWSEMQQTMTRRPGTSSEVTKANLLASAAAEFSHVLYDKASLRVICRNADVTTGALYFFFDSKEDLFSAVVTPVIDEIISIIEKVLPAEFLLLQGEITEEEVNATIVDEIVKLVNGRRDNVAALAMNREHPLVVEKRTEISTLIDNFFRDCIGSGTSLTSKKPETDEFAIAWLTSISLALFTRLLYDHASDEEIRERVLFATTFIRGGFKALDSNPQ